MPATVLDVSQWYWKPTTFTRWTTVTGRQALYRAATIFENKHGYLKTIRQIWPLYESFEPRFLLATVRDVRHCIHDWSLAYSFICTYCTGWYQSAEAWAARSGPPPWASACSGSSCPSSGIYNSFLCDNISVKKDQVLLSPRVIMSLVSSFQQLSLGMLTKVAN